MPDVLYIRGELPDPRKPAAAIVGARACSRYGEQQAYRFAKVLAENGIQVISGLARGIDGMDSYNEKKWSNKSLANVEKKR